MRLIIFLWFLDVLTQCELNQFSQKEMSHEVSHSLKIYLSNTVTAV